MTTQDDQRRADLREIADTPLTDEQVDRITAMALAEPAPLVTEQDVDRTLFVFEDWLPPKGADTSTWNQHDCERLAIRDALLAVAPAMRDRWVADVLAERDRARATAVALEAECAALTEALGDPGLTHPWTQQHPHSACCGFPDDRHGLCGAMPMAAVHQTPAEVRRRRGLGAE